MTAAKLLSAASLQPGGRPSGHVLRELAGGGTGEIASALHDLVECPIAILDSNGQPIAIVPTGTDLSDLPSTSIRHPIVAGEHHYGEIIARTDDPPFDDDRLLALERASTAVAIRLAHAGVAAGVCWRSLPTP